MEAGPPTGKDIQIEISSRRPELLEEAVRRVRGHLEEVQGLKDIDDSRPVPGVEWQVRVDRAQASRFGADISLVGGYVQFVTNGLLLGTYRPEGTDDEVDIRARFPWDERDLAHIRNLRVTTAHGSIPVTNFIEWEPAPLVGQIERVDGKRYYMVTANVDRNVLTDTKVQELRQWQSGLTLPEGLSIRFRGEDEEQKQSMAFLSKAFFVALFIMAIILVTQFNSFFQAFLVLTAVLFSTIGVFIGLLITGQPFGVVMNGIGVISLAGIVVNNNIVLIDTFDYHRKAGADVLDAVLRTGAQRLRPVLLTTITTVLGLMPMVLRLNIDLINRKVTYNAPSTQWWVQLSTSVAFGLIFATFLTLILTPSLLVMGDNIGRWVRRRRSARAGMGISV
jgi:multidrug efflux pump